MSVELTARFLIGGILVSAFAVLGDIFRPKSFAGLFGAAPSIALATLGLAFYKSGDEFCAVEARSMIVGAAALWVYCRGMSYLLKRVELSAMPATLIMVAGWLAVAGAGRMMLG